MDWSVIYSKTPKGLRARSSWIGGLSSHLMKVLLLVDGTSKAEAILANSDDLTEQELERALTKLESDGYIRPVLTRAVEDWAPSHTFASMVVEEIHPTEDILVEEVPAETLDFSNFTAEADAKAKAEAERKAMVEAEEKARLEAEHIARERAQALAKAEAEARLKAEEESRAKAAEKARVEAEENARIEAERVAREQAQALAKAKAEEAARLKAEAERKAQAEAEEKARIEAERVAREKAERQAKAEEEARLKAEVEARAKAEEAARLEAERKAREEAETRARAEAEEKARLEAERKAKAEAEEKARIEAERVAREQALAKAKAEEEARREAERQALEEAEQVRARAEAEEKARIEAEENARREMERIAREAEEARIRSEAEARAKAEEAARLEAERKARAEAEEKARIEAERVVREEAERQAKAEEEARLKAEAEARARAEEAARLEAERKAREEAESQARAAAEEEARLEAERKAQAEAEEKARIEAERVAREEAERQAKAEEEARLKAEAEARARAEEAARLEAERKAREAAEACALAEAEEKARKEAERLAKEEEKAAREAEKAARKEAEKQAKEEAKRIAREEAEAKARLKAEEKAQARVSAGTPGAGKWVSKVIMATLVFVPLAALLLVGLLHVVNLSMLVKPVEQLASESAGEPVTVGKVHASLWPQPHLVIGDVAIGGTKVESIHVLPDTATLFEAVKVVKSLEIEGLKVEQKNFGQPLAWINGSAKSQHLKIETIKLKKISLLIRDLELGPLAGSVGLTELRELKNIELDSADRALSIRLSPQGGNFEIELAATSWPLPANPQVVFDELNAKGVASQSQASFSQIEGKIYGGSLKAKANVDWSDQWSASGNFDLSGASLSLMLKAFGSSASVDGDLNLAGNFAGKSGEAVGLGGATEVAAQFSLRNGKIGGIDLVRAVLAGGNQSLAGDVTRFDKFAGSVQIKDGRYQYRQLVLDAAKFHARGNVDILPDQRVSGKISAELTTPSRRLQANIGLGGKVGDVKQQ